MRLFPECEGPFPWMASQSKHPPPFCVPLSFCPGGCRFLCWRDFCGNVSTVHEVLCALFLLLTWHPLGCAVWTCAAATPLAGAAHTGFLHSVAPFFPHGRSNVSKCCSLGNSFFFICCSDQAALNIPDEFPVHLHSRFSGGMF